MHAYHKWHSNPLVRWLKTQFTQMNFGWIALVMAMFSPPPPSFPIVLVVLCAWATAASLGPERTAFNMQSAQPRICFRSSGNASEYVPRFFHLLFAHLAPQLNAEWYFYTLTTIGLCSKSDFNGAFITEHIFLIAFHTDVSPEALCISALGGECAVCIFGCSGNAFPSASITERLSLHIFLTKD